MVLADADNDGGNLDGFDPFSREDDISEESKAVKAQTFERELLCLDAVHEPGEAKTAHLTPVFLGHGSADEKVPLRLGQAAAAVMTAAGYSVDWKCYPEQGHWYKVPDEIDDIICFINGRAGWAVSRDDLAA